MGGVLDDLKNAATGLWNQGVSATVAQITDMQARAATLRALAADMLTQRQQLEKKLPAVSAKSPQAAASVRDHIQRGYDLQAKVQGVLQKVDSILASLKSGTANAAINGLGIVAPAAAAIVPYTVLAGVLGTVGAVTYAIHAYNKKTEYLTGVVDAVVKGGGSPSQIIQAANASAGNGGNTGSGWLSMNTLLLVGVAGLGFYLWKRGRA